MEESAVHYTGGFAGTMLLTALIFRLPQLPPKLLISEIMPLLDSDCRLLYEDPESVIRERHPLLAKEFDNRNWRFPGSIDRVYDSSYAEQILGWRAKRGPLEVLKQFDNGDFEILPPL